MLAPFALFSIALGASYRLLARPFFDDGRFLAWSLSHGLLNSPDGAASLGDPQHSIAIEPAGPNHPDGDFMKGSSRPRLIMIEFGDFQCPACGGAYPILKFVSEKRNKDMLFVFKNYPMDLACNPVVKETFHPEACKLAAYARCIGLLGRFWEIHDFIFSKYGFVSDSDLQFWSQNRGLDFDSIKSCADSAGTIEKITSDARQASALGVNGTPAIFLNGKRYIGPRSIRALNDLVTRLLEDRGSPK